MTNVEYMDKVLDYLEYLGYPEYVLEFNRDDVAKSMAGFAYELYIRKISYRMCAVSIFGHIMEMQIMKSGS